MPVLKFQDKEPQVGKGCFIASTASVIGEVFLGKDSSVWFNAVLRGDVDKIIIGEKSNIQDNCVVHMDFHVPAIIGNQVTVGHGAVIHGCTIGDRCLIGMGAVILSRAQIGEECIIGAGTLIPEGKVIPPRSVVMGVPGKIVRKVTSEEVENLAEQAEHYVEMSRKYF